MGRSTFLIFTIAAPFFACQFDPVDEVAQQLPPLLSPALPSSGKGVEFAEVTEKAGIHFVHSFGDRSFSNLVEAVGSGATFFDFDQDGWLDIYLASGKWAEGVSEGPSSGDEPSNRLYRNLGNGTFQDVTRQAGVGAERSFNTGIAVGDYNNDGFPDLYVCGFGRSILFSNRGNGTFADRSEYAGVENPDRFAVAASWLDFDRDGYLDLYVSNYIEFDPDYDQYYAPDGFPGPLAYEPQPDTLFRNRGDGTFEDVGERTGVSSFAGRGMSVGAVDYDRDGFQDIYVTNDATENFLFHNDAGRGFSQRALESGVGFNGMGDSTASMGVDFADYDGDGAIDFFVSDSSISSLYRNLGNGEFEDQIIEAGLAHSGAQFVGWGAFFFDYDNDGDSDILVVNSDLSRLFGQEDQVFENLGDGRFSDSSSLLGEHFRRALLGRGACYGDYDNDGDLDVLILNVGSPAILLRNDGGNQNGWLRVHLTGTRSHRDAFGAIVHIWTGDGQQIALKKSSSGYLSQNEPQVHFGIGSNASVERLEVTWPSGIRQTLEELVANQTISLQEPESRE